LFYVSRHTNMEVINGMFRAYMKKIVRRGGKKLNALNNR